MSDEEIIRLVLNGHTEMYAELVDKYKNLIFDMCYKYTYDYVESQDLSQEIFLKVFQKLYTYNGSSSFSTWLYRVGTNTCIDWARKKKKSKNTVSIDDDECINRLPSENQDVEDSVIEWERKKLVRNAVMALPEKYRTVVILYNFKGLSCSEIAKVLGSPVKTVETRLYRAKKLLKESLLKPYHGGEYVWNAVK